MLQWWVDGAYFHCPVFLGWVDKLYDTPALHSPQSSQAGVVLVSPPPGNWRIPKGGTAAAISARTRTAGTWWNHFWLLHLVPHLLAHALNHKSFQDSTTNRIKNQTMNQRIEISKSLSILSSSQKSFFPLQPCSIRFFCFAPPYV